MFIDSKWQPDWVSFFDEFQKESPRSAAIIGSAFLDTTLRELLATFMIDDKKAINELLGSESGTEGLISSFSARIAAAYCLGLVSKMEYNDLNCIRKIRNKFAHKNYGFTFENSEITKLCNNLQTPTELNQILPPEIDNPSGRFVFTVCYLSPLLNLRILDIRKERRVARDETKIGEIVRVK